MKMFEELVKMAGDDLVRSSDRGDAAFKKFEAALWREVIQAADAGWFVQISPIPGMQCCCPLGALASLRDTRLSPKSYPTVTVAAQAWGINLKDAADFVSGFEWHSVTSEDDTLYTTLGREYRALFTRRQGIKAQGTR